MTRQEAAMAGTETRIARLLRGSWVPVCLILGSATFLGSDASKPVKLLNAQVSFALDTDGDGLVDVVERQLGTRIRSVDTDGDGISDGEEVARGSSPRLHHSVPRQRPVDVGMIAHSHNAMVHVQMLVYSRDGELRGKNIVVSALAGEEGRLIQVPTSALIRLGGLSSFPASGGGRVFVLDLPVRPRTIYAANSLSVSASVAAPSTGEPGSADVLDLINLDGTICLRVDSEILMNSSSLPASSRSGQSVTIDATGGTDNTSSVFLPIFNPGSGPEHEDPDQGTAITTSTPGQICVQQTVQVGISGGGVIHEIVASECVDGWDGFCSSACANNVGGRIRTIDPFTYSGG